MVLGAKSTYPQTTLMQSSRKRKISDSDSSWNGDDNISKFSDGVVTHREQASLEILEFYQQALEQRLQQLEKENKQLKSWLDPSWPLASPA
mmetsp:Transcript_2229/g.4133  ORF Transcript_2229/g.4133 Transcript_2229/m.4133 type:complete len:91 (+) Transcript_2229:162-434(+)|eukprot:CAMPEP_0196657962 /NCGR_PEP_ID=MMETSP1086-20130531/26426_1 /TAXON_ID=77921 /ORGANISM="Cyanoptyche  gloeocystis , Strain SAG4.97" /LENGTH=90 /DNA_ID=CAMNT_0041991291 /DNA_START=158 /DNA_END=430 /DNA_ORIENTATION=+